MTKTSARRLVFRIKLYDLNDLFLLNADRTVSLSRHGCRAVRRLRLQLGMPARLKR
jgi:hypothetical protein